MFTNVTSNSSNTNNSYICASASNNASLETTNLTQVVNNISNKKNKR
jgi:hypothetical protein